MKSGGITRSTGFQVLLYFVMATGALCASFCILMVVWLWNWGANDNSFAEFEKRMMSNEAYEHLDYICHNDWNYPTLEDMIEAFEAESETNNIKYAIYDMQTNEMLWTNTSSVHRKWYYQYEGYFSRRAGNMTIGTGIETEVPVTDAEVVIVVEDKVYDTFLEDEFKDYKAVL